MRRSLIIGLLTAVLTAACGGGSGADPASTEASSSVPADETTTTTTTTEALALPAEFHLGDSDNGAVLRVHPGDAITMSLRIEDPSDPLWIIAREPDPAILEIADSLLWTPSDPGAEPTHFEFVFLVVGTGETAVTFSLGPLTPTSRTLGFTVVSD